MTDEQLRAYRKQHPALFPQHPAPATLPGAGLPRSVSNGYDNEAAFQEDVKRELEARGWHVQESLKGSARGGSVWYGAGWPDLQIYRSVRAVWFAELKQPGNKPSDVQLTCHARLRVCGFRVVVAWTLAEVLAIEEEQKERCEP